MVGKYNLIIDDSIFFFTFFPLPQTSQPVTFPDGSLAQEGSEPCRPRWLVSWVEQGWSEYKSDNQRFSNHLQFSTGCPQVCSIFIGASVNVWPVNPMRYLVQLLPISICLKLDIVRRQWYLVWRPHFKLGEERLRAKFIHVFFPWDYHTCIIWKGLWGGQVCGHLPKGVVAEKPDWAAFFFVKAPAECQINKFLSEAETYAGNAPFWPQHWIPWFGVWVMSWSMNWPIWNK